MKYRRSIKGLFTELKRSAKRRGIALELTIEQLTVLRQSDCFYCGQRLCLAGYGIDRKDSQKGYTWRNSVACCGRCNKLKSDLLSHRQMLIVAAALGWLIKGKKN